MRRSSLAVLALVLPAALDGCAVNPVSGRPEVTLVSARQERELGREEAAKVAATMGIVDDPPTVVAYVKQIGARLAAESPLRDVPYTFQVVDMPEPNAFALPGGWVYVSRGLVALMNSEDELAGVLGHEVAHVAARHAVQRVSRAAPIGILTGLGAAATGLVSPMLGSIVGGIGEAANALVLSPYSREQEREADRVGAEIAAKAGWDPAALASALQTLEREDALNRKGQSERSSFFATHPPLPERVSASRAFAAGLARAPVAAIAPGRDAFVQRIEGVVVGQSAAEGVFDGQTFVHPDLDFAVTFPEAWKTANGREAVAAREPGGAAAIVVDVAGRGDDPKRVLAEVDAKEGTKLAAGAQPFEVGGRPAVRTALQTRTADGVMAVDVTLIAHRGLIFRIAGVTRAASYDRFGEAFRRTATSFTSPTPAQLGRIRQARLRVAAAAPGETPEALARRKGGVWPPEMIAVANGVEASERLPAGFLTKIAVEEPYRPRP